MEQTKLQSLIKILLESDCKELYVESELEKIKIIRSYSEQIKTKKPISVANIENEKQENTLSPENPIKSSLVGVFHFSNKYKIGDKIVVGEKIGYVESLKIKTDIVSDFSGNITEIVTNDGETVEFGQTIIIIK